MSCAIILNPESAEFFVHVFEEFVVVIEEGDLAYAYIPCKSIGFNAEGDVIANLPEDHGILHVPHRWVSAIWEAGSNKAFPGFFRSPSEAPEE